MDETGTLPSAGSSRFRFNGFANLASQHDKSAHPEVKRFLTGKEEQRNRIYLRDENHLNGVAKKPGQFPARVEVQLCRQVEAVGVHDLGPCCHEVADELFVVVILSIHFSVSTQD
ncbi:hypothetical protein SAMN05444141_11095 [Pseudovibrio denitrificans]|uniref:Uncharacterized protein n=1 Tax=Pseudovibrio denitrificans TaxID=258256 RepID=A0A1I7DTL7_9HYPH|nr:hypothetical protein SAMN05444141_11095 [Pseudovibrio denitrificans]